MKCSRKRSRLFLAVASTVPVLCFASAASAHANLESSSPSPSATLEVAPRSIVLDFSEPVGLVERSVEVFDERQDRITIPNPQLSAADRVEVNDLPPLDSGLYLVVWRVQSQDGHIAQGAYTFQIGTDARAVTADDLLAGVDALGSGPRGLDTARAVSRTLVYLGLAGALGSLAFVASARFDEPRSRSRVRRVIGIGWIAAALGTLGQFLVQGVYVSGGTWSDLLDSSAWQDVWSTRSGQGLIVRLALLGCLGALIFVSTRRNAVLPTTWWRSSSALVGGGIVVSFAATGHLSASSPAAVASGAGAVHLASVLLWIGGLLVLVFGERTSEIVRSFSRTASFAIPIALITGIWQAWHLVENPADLTSTDWGRALVVKVVFVVAIVSIAMIARLALRSGHSSSGIESVRRLVVVEVIFAVVVVVATSIMVSSPPRVGSAPAVITATLAQDDIIVNATVTPGMVGANEIHITVVTPGGSLDPVDGLEMRMTYEDGDLPPVTVNVEPLGPNHYLGTVSILESGVWDLEIIVQVSPSRVVRLTMDVDV